MPKKTKVVFSGQRAKESKTKVQPRVSVTVTPNPVVESYLKEIQAIKDLEKNSWQYVSLLNEKMLNAPEGEPTQATLESFPLIKNPQTGETCRSRITSVKWLETGIVKEKGKQKETVRPIYIKPKELLNYNKNKFKESSKRVRKLVEDWGGQGGDQWTWAQGGPGLGLGQTAAYPPGPFTRQLYLQAMWEMQSRCFEIYNHYGIAKSAINTISYFTVGDGVKVDFDDEESQVVWDEFCTRTHLDRDWQQYCMMLSVNGEMIFHLPPLKIAGMKGFTDLLSVDPGTLWEVITIPRDIRKVKSYWVQYATQYQIYSVPGVAFADYIIEQLDPAEVLHVTINIQKNEKRGRSDLLASLSDLKRLQEITNYRGVKIINESALVFDQKITGQDTDVTAIANLPNSFLGAGSTYTHNESSELAVVQGTGRTGDRSGFHDEQLSQIGTGTGSMPAEFIGGGSGSNRANALTKTEPSYKFFRSRQKKIEYTIKDMAKIVIDNWNKANDTNYSAECEVIFPEIAPEDRKDKLANIVLMESQQYWDHEKAATTAAKEMDDTSYDFKATQDKIKQERLADPQLAFLFTPQAAGAIGGVQNIGGAPAGTDAPTQVGAANKTRPQLGPSATPLQAKPNMGALASPKPTSQYGTNSMGVGSATKKNIKSQLKQKSEAAVVEKHAGASLHKTAKAGHKQLSRGFRGRTSHTVHAGETLSVGAFPAQMRAMDEAEANGYDKEWEAACESGYADIDWKEVAPPGWEPSVKKMKSHPEIENPFALAWFLDSQGAKPHAGKK